jgi:uncharacterized protein (DUF2225 family)
VREKHIVKDRWLPSAAINCLFGAWGYKKGQIHQIAIKILKQNINAITCKYSDNFADFAEMPVCTTG